MSFRPTLRSPQHIDRSVPRQCMALVPNFDSGSQQSGEIPGMLRTRLRVACVIALAGFFAFFVKGLVAPYPDQTVMDLILHGAIVGLQALCCLILFSRLSLRISCLRTLEAVLFGSMALFFAYLQYRIFADGHFLEWATRGHEEEVMSLAVNANTFRWFTLIVLYGMFIPNTWQRCVMVISAIAATPLAMTFVICFPCPVMGHHWGHATFDEAAMLSLGAAIALFGSYKINTLQDAARAARKLGQYRLLRRLGAGGMGEVYLGEHMLLRRQCAIKVIRHEQSSDATAVSRFEREVQAMATLTHWNTVEVYDYGHDPEGTFYYVMEYLPGISLQDMVDRHGPLPASRAIYFLRQLCGALREAHGIGLIHRDIKPSNVIVCKRGGIEDVAKLLDFGLVQDLAVNPQDGKLTMQGSILGSPPFISPEQAIGKNEVDARTDIYALGGLAYFLLTGHPPFERESTMELLVAHIHEDPAPIRRLESTAPEAVERVVMRCLRKKPDERFASVIELEHALAACPAADEWNCDLAAQWWEAHATTTTPASDDSTAPTVDLPASEASLAP
ncbi:MAG: serine/threonine protein kinase [Gemmataceae bacterium]|nr:serine/threonine protein kinase [Gemmataceae bacterium]